MLATASTIAAARWNTLFTRLSRLSTKLNQFQPTRSHYQAGAGVVVLLVSAIVSYRYYIRYRYDSPTPSLSANAVFAHSHQTDRG